MAEWSLFDLYLTLSIVFSVLIILSNIAFIACVLGSTSRVKTSAGHQLMVSISVVDLILGSFVIPILIRTMVGKEDLVCYLHVAIETFGNYGVFFITGWSFVTLNLLFLCGTVWPGWLCTRPRVPNWVKTTVLCIWPWLASIAFLTPIVYHKMPYEAIHTIHWDDPMCLTIYDINTALILRSLCFLLPMTINAVAVVLLISIFIRELRVTTAAENQPERLVDRTTQVCLINSPHDRDGSNTASVKNHPLAICLPNLVYFICYLPVTFTVFTRLRVQHDGTISHAESLLVLITSLARPVVLPMSWMALATVRQQVTVYTSRLWSSIVQCFCQRIPGSSSGAVSYTGMREVTTA